MNKGHLRLLTAAWLGALAAMPVSAAESSNRYDTGFTTLQRIAGDLHRALPVEKRADLGPTPMLRLENPATPYLQLRRAGSNDSQVLFVSQGLIDVLNYVSHAKAVDQVDAGFFEKAVEGLVRQTGTELRGLPQPADTNAWAFNTMNWQMSHFNQMAAGLTAVQMAHHYLGHYKKYAAQLGEGKDAAPLYSLLTPREWREAVLAGSRHALDCGLAPEGLVVLYDAITRMPQRPAWALQVIPPGAEISILRMELNRVEAMFFDSRTSVRDELKWSW
jgi:hypothetical protein